MHRRFRMQWTKRRGPEEKTTHPVRSLPLRSLRSTLLLLTASPWSLPSSRMRTSMISFASYPGRTTADTVDSSMPDPKVIGGTIPTMIDDVAESVARNLLMHRVSRGSGASDELEIPIDTLRRSSSPSSPIAITAALSSEIRFWSNSSRTVEAWAIPKSWGVVGSGPLV